MLIQSFETLQTFLCAWKSLWMLQMYLCNDIIVCNISNIVRFGMIKYILKAFFFFSVMGVSRTWKRYKVSGRKAEGSVPSTIYTLLKIHKRCEHLPVPGLSYCVLLYQTNNRKGLQKHRQFLTHTSSILSVFWHKFIV